MLEDKGVLRHGQPVQTDVGPGVVTSGTYSPSLQRSIGLVRVPADAGAECSVDIRGALKKARLVKPPFVRKVRFWSTNGRINAGCDLAFD